MKKELDFWRRFATAVALAWAVTALLFSLALTKATGTVKDRIREANDKTQTCRQDAMSYWYDELSNCKSREKVSKGF